MTHYIALVHKDEGSAYGLTFPDLPGCFSAADDEHDLVPNASEAIALWGEDQPLPTPSGIEALRVREDVSAELRDGAFLLAVPAPVAEAA